jgi:hypothetical protein
MSFEYLPHDKINLDDLITFYNNVWGEYKEYVENDKSLYFIFDKKNEHIFSKRVKVLTLNKMYSAGLDDIQINNFCNKFEWDITCEKYQKNGDNGKAKKQISIESKLCHWNSEVNNLENAVPIYDRNVRKALSYYKIKAEKNTVDFLKIKSQIDTFISKFLGKKETVKVNVDGLPPQISIYRLVDKFLWLSYKMRYNEDKLEGLIKQYNTTFFSS